MTSTEPAAPSATYDRRLGSAYVRLTAAPIASTTSLSDLVLLDLDAAGTPAGVEVLWAREYYVALRARQECIAELEARHAAMPRSARLQRIGMRSAIDLLRAGLPDHSGCGRPAPDLQPGEQVASENSSAAPDQLCGKDGPEPQADLRAQVRAAADRMRHALPDLREGQSLANALRVLRPVLAADIRGTTDDPFNFDERIGAFWVRVAAADPPAA